MKFLVAVILVGATPIDSIYPQFALDLQNTANYNINVTKKTANKRPYNKLVKKLVKIVDTVKGNVSYWKLWLLDSWPRLPSGLLRKGPMFFLGDYDLCMNIATSTSQNGNNLVHYCRSRTKVYLLEVATSITTGFCLPMSCHEKAVESVANRFVQEFIGISNLTTRQVSFQGVECHGLNPQWYMQKNILILTVIMLLFLLVIGTSIDYVMERRRGAIASKNQPTSYGSESTIVFDSNQELHALTCFNAPSIAMTYKYAPDLKKSFMSSSVLVDMIRSFSIRISAQHLLRNTAKEVPCLNGIKVLSSLWVIFGHACLFTLPYMDNFSTLLPMLVDSQWLAPALLNSSLAVDSFLFVSGTVVAFNYRKRILFRGEEKKDSISHTVYRLCMFYTHRLCRLWPAVLLTTVFMSFMFNHLGDGPLWSSKGVFGTVCPMEAIWPHLLFLSNWFPSNCLPWLWYIAVDFQLYLFSPLFLFVLRWHRLAKAIAICLLILSTSYQVAVYTMNTLPANAFVGLLSGKNIESAETSFRLLHASPIARCSSFVIGLLTGWTACVRTSRHLSSTYSYLLHFIAILLMYFAVFSPFCHEGLSSYLHAVVHRTVWSVALSIMVWLCENGYSPCVSFVLSSPRLLVFSRLSFGVFLTHEPLLLYHIWSSRVPHSPHSFTHFLWLTLTIFVLSLILAFILAISIEIPVLSMERKLFKTTECHVSESSSFAVSRERLDQWSAKEPTFYEKATSWLQEGSICQKQGHEGTLKLPATEYSPKCIMNASRCQKGDEGQGLNFPVTACTSICTVNRPHCPKREEVLPSVPVTACTSIYTVNAAHCQKGNDGAPMLPVTACTSMFTMNAPHCMGKERARSLPVSACTSIFSINASHCAENERLIGHHAQQPSSMDNSTQGDLNSFDENAPLNIRQWEKSLYSTC